MEKKTLRIWPLLLSVLLLTALLPVTPAQAVDGRLERPVFLPHYPAHRLGDLPWGFLLDRSNVMWKWTAGRKGAYKAESMESEYKMFSPNMALRKDGTVEWLCARDQKDPGEWKSCLKNVVSIRSRDTRAYDTAFFALDDHGDLYTWGHNGHGRLGYAESEFPDNSDSNQVVGWGLQMTPRKILSNVRSFRLAPNYGGWAIKNDNTMWSWGSEGPLIPEDVHDSQGIWYGAPTYWQSAPVHVMDNVLDYQYGAVVRPDHTAEIPGRHQETVEQLVETAAIHMGYEQRGRLFLKADGTLWANGDPAFLNVAADSKTADMWGDPVVPWRSAPVKVMDQVFAIYEDEYDKVTYILRKDGQIDVVDSAVPTFAERKQLAFQSPADLCAGLPPFAGFLDVKAQDYFAEPVKWAVDHNVTNGMTATTFGPGETCTRGHILTFLNRACGSPAGHGVFTDVKPGDFFARAAAWAADNELVTGSSFSAAVPCTRADTVTYLWKLAGRPAAATDKFTDVPADAPYAAAVAWAVENRVTDGTSAATFSPEGICTRGQIVTFLYRAAKNVPGLGLANARTA